MKPLHVRRFLRNYYKSYLIKHLRIFFWFSVGIFLGIFFLSGFGFVIFQEAHKNVVYPGIVVNGVNMGGKTKEDVKNYFEKRNQKSEDVKLVFQYNQISKTIPASELSLGYNSSLIAEQTYSIGRSPNLLANISLVFQAYINGLDIPPSFKYNEENLLAALSPIFEEINTPAENAVFKFENGRVTAFKLSKNGQEVDIEELKSNIYLRIFPIIEGPKQEYVTLSIPVRVIEPEITSDKVNNLGIKELIGEGTSLFQHSIPNRIYNITLGSTRVNGSLIAPGEVFSIAEAIGDISSFTGYKQAYVIQNGKTILGDGGGVCQISTTLFRAILNAGLPITERHAHSYRVGYYEQDSPPGIDATVFVPSIDLKFKNDTKNYILIQTSIDPAIQKLTFSLYGTKDGRVSVVGKPVITSESAAPPPVYQDDPTLPKGELRQIDFAASGARVYFTRQVTKDGTEIINEKFSSVYQPWRAVYLRGTKE